MTLTNWIGIALAAAILTTGILLYRYFHNKFKDMDGFEGIVTERGKRRRVDFNWEAEIERLEKELAEK